MGWKFERERIQVAMDARDISLADLAKRTDTTPQQVTQWQNGDVSPGMESFMKIVNALDTHPKFFFVQTVND